MIAIYNVLKLPIVSYLLIWTRNTKVYQYSTGDWYTAIHFFLQTGCTLKSLTIHKR